MLLCVYVHWPDASMDVQAENKTPSKHTHVTDWMLYLHMYLQ